MGFFFLIPEKQSGKQRQVSPESLSHMMEKETQPHQLLLGVSLILDLIRYLCVYSVVPVLLNSKVKCLNLIPFNCFVKRIIVPACGDNDNELHLS